MNHPPEIIKAIDDALSSVYFDINERIKENEDYSDLEFIKQELIEMKNGTRLKASGSLSRMIIDSMDWEQPCLKKFNEVRSLLRKHYRLRP